jgi:hypothetical protein
VSWRERLEVAVAALVVGVLGAGFLAAVVVAPGLRPRLTHADDAVPEEKPSYECSRWRESGVPCERERDYQWTLPAGGSVRTTWLTSRRDTDQVRGVLALSREDCPEAGVSWTLTAAGHTSSGLLPAEYPSGLLQARLSGDQHRITLEFRRTDTSSCAAAVKWIVAAVEAPWLGVMWSWW